MTLTANPDGVHGWQVRVMTLAANADGNYGWQVQVTTLAANPDGNYGCPVRVMTLTYTYLTYDPYLPLYKTSFCMQCKNDSTVINESDSADKPLHS